MHPVSEKGLVFGYTRKDDKLYFNAWSITDGKLLWSKEGFRETWDVPTPAPIVLPDGRVVVTIQTVPKMPAQRGDRGVIVVRDGATGAEVSRVAPASNHEPKECFDPPGKYCVRVFSGTFDEGKLMSFDPLVGKLVPLKSASAPAAGS